MVASTAQARFALGPALARWSSLEGSRRGFDRHPDPFGNDCPPIVSHVNTTDELPSAERSRGQNSDRPARGDGRFHRARRTRTLRTNNGIKGWMFQLKIARPVESSSITFTQPWEVFDRRPPARDFSTTAVRRSAFAKRDNDGFEKIEFRLIRRHNDRTRSAGPCRARPRFDGKLNPQGRRSRSMEVGPALPSLPCDPFISFLQPSPLSPTRPILRAVTLESSGPFDRFSG